MVCLSVFNRNKASKCTCSFFVKGDEVYKKLEKCSGGERARIALLKLMLGQFNFLLLDEPTNHLDAFSREELENTLLNYSGTMLIVSHDRYFINKLATAIVELTPEGVNSYIGNYDDYAEKRCVSLESEKKEKPVKVNDYKLKKERASMLRKLKTRLSRLEDEIEDAEDKAGLLQEELCTNPPYEELLKVTEELDAVNKHKDALYEEWEQLSEELTQLED